MRVHVRDQRILQNFCKVAEIGLLQLSKLQAICPKNQFMFSPFPILCAYLSAIPSALLILLIDPVKALIFVIFLVVLQQFEGNVIYPRVVGGSIGIGGMWVLLALTVGGNLMGITGMVLGIPAFAVIYALVKEFCDKRIAAKDAAAKAAAPTAETEKSAEG